MGTKKAETSIEKLEYKIRDCYNDTSIFNTKKYVLFNDAKKILEESITSQQQAIERLREELKFLYNLSKEIIDDSMELSESEALRLNEIEEFLNTTEPMNHE